MSDGQNERQAFSVCEYIYDADHWDCTYDTSMLSDMLDDRFWDDPNAVVRVGRLALMTNKFAVRIPVSEDETEVQFFDSEIAAERALASAMSAVAKRDAQ